MLLQLENTSSANLKKLLEYARQLNLNLRLIDQETNKAALPGKPLSEAALRTMIENGRKTGIISMEKAHRTIRDNFHGD
jgi:hypothetical protein